MRKRKKGFTDNGIPGELDSDGSFIPETADQPVYTARLPSDRSDFFTPEEYPDPSSGNME